MQPIPGQVTALQSMFERERERRRCEGSLMEFCKRAWSIVEPGVAFVGGWHLEALCAHLEAVTDGRIKRLLINVPPRTSKSTIVSVMWPCWEWTRNPAHKYLCATYSGTLSTRDNLKARRVITSDWYQGHWGNKVRLSSDQNQKCLAAGSRLMLEDGSLRAIEDIRPGDRVLTLIDGRVAVDTIVHQWSNGVKPLRKLTLSDGTVIRATHNHRFFGDRDWQYVEHMRVGDPLAVAYRLPEPPGAASPNDPTQLTEDDAFLLALWLAEGPKRESSFAVTNADALIVERLCDIAESRGWTVTPYDDYGYRVTAGYSQTGDTPNAVLKKHLGSCETYGSQSKRVEQNTFTIRVPNAVFKASNEVIKVFLGTYLACDGYVGADNANAALSWFSGSRGMAQDITLLLKRFSVRSRYETQTPTYEYKGEKLQGADSYRVMVCGRIEILKLEGITAFAKTEKVERLVDSCKIAGRHTGSRSATVPPCYGVGLPGHRGGWVSRHTMAKYAATNSTAKGLVESDFDWRKIVEIVEQPAEETFHVETLNSGTFLVEGIFSHNTRFENTQFGYRLATSVGGTATGEGGSRIILDDPHSAAEAQSDLMRQGAVDWVRYTMSSRLNTPKEDAIVVVMQRLHEEDVSGYLMGSGGYQHLCLPMRYELDPETGKRRTSLLGDYDKRTKPGELLMPDRFGEVEVEFLETQLGEYGSAGQLQQRPAPAGGGILKVDHIQLWRYHLALPAITFIVQSYDTAFTDNPDSDYTAGTVFGIFWHTTRLKWCALILDSWNDKLTYPKLREKVIGDWNAKYGTDGEGRIGRKADVVLVEEKASGISLLQDLRLANVPVIGYNPGRANKVQRAHLIAPLLELDCIYVLESGKRPNQPISWVRPLIDQMGKFPNSKKKDLVDSLTQALLYIKDNSLLELPYHEEDVENYYQKKQFNPYSQ